MSVFASLAQRYRVSEEPLRTERRIELLVLAMVVLLLLLLLYAATRLMGVTPPDAITPAADSLVTRVPLAHASASVEERQAILNRPLFWPSRRPVDDEIVVNEATSEKNRPLDGVKLVGLFGGGDSAGIIARVEEQDRRVTLGGEVNGWTLKSVGQDGALFESGAEQKRLPLELVLDKGGNKNKPIRGRRGRRGD